MRLRVTGKGQSIKQDDANNQATDKEQELTVIVDSNAIPRPRAMTV
jgi:hypothetical protein